MADIDKNSLPDKHAPVYTIGVASELVGVSVASLRKYEEANFLLPHRTESNHRRYSQVDIEILHCVRRMIERCGMSINGLGRILALIPCWAIKGCPEEDRENCDAYYNEDIPCWAANINHGVCAEEDCRLCDVYECATDACHLKAILKRYIE